MARQGRGVPGALAFTLSPRGDPPPDRNTGRQRGNSEDLKHMSEVIRIIQKEHANMAALVKALEKQLADFEQGIAPDYDVIRGVLNYFLSFPDIYHHPKEDLIFQRLREVAPEQASSIGDLRRDHEELDGRTREFAEGITAVLEEAQVPREALLRWGKAFIQLQRDHMMMEESRFLPLAEQSLSDEDWTALAAAMTSQEDPLFGENVGQQFETLRKNILKWQAETLAERG
ncbi:Hemerythrin [uncultured Defluviicoccus sp.]|uniref:Hemerythrin n=1 Tax=metagenome TaxID=256318 RepID=A0A380TDJ4_9ZZZZ|nr:Hemerythrin [uncultured Defluviicoccus sp.]